MDAQTGTGLRGERKTINDDERVAKLLAEGWVFHSNYDPKLPGDLEEMLRTSQFFYQRPSNAREVLIIDTAYGMDGQHFPLLKAIYMRDFVPVEEATRRMQANMGPRRPITGEYGGVA